MVTSYNRGLTLVEILFGVAIVSLVLVFASHTIVLFLSASEQALQQTRATYLAEEGYKLVQYVRDEDWNTIANLTENDTYSFSISTSSVSVVSGTEEIDGTFTRSFTVEELLRNSEDDVVSSGGTADPDARIVTITIEWNDEQISLASIITNLHDI